mgnify:CR=1 FL=1|tara:strand:- start:7 stop:2292 length:2286 start_codon:yes stop_codon:yes gene_type:complete
MLGLANILSATSSTDQETYSLALDGTGDYLATVLVPNKDVGTFSFWFKVNELKNYNTLFENAVDGDDWEAWVDGDGDLNFRTDAGDVVLTKATAISIGAWYHVAITYTVSGGGVLYLNGAAVHTDSDVAGSRPTPEAMSIGGGALNTDLNGSIDDFAVFNVALSAAEVAGIYNNGRPFNLTNDYGDYDQSAALVAYWKMFDGAFDDKVNGIIHDAHNPGYGSQLWDGIDGDDANWNMSQSGTNDKDEVDGAVQFTYIDNATGGYIRLKEDHDVNTDLTIGATYKCTFETKTSTGTNNWQINDGADSGSVTYVSNPSNVTTGQFQSQVIYFRAGHTQNAFLILKNMGSGEVTQIKNISLKQLNGFPGLTAAQATFSTDTPSKAPRGYSLKCDGTGDFLNLGNVLDFGTSDFVVSIWFKIDDASRTGEYIISKYADANNQFFISCNSNSKIGCSTKHGDGSAGTTILNKETPVINALDNSWVNFIVSCDRDGTAAIYVNGTTDTYGITAFNPGGDTTDISNAADLVIGRRSTGSAEFKGNIDGAAIWTHADLSDFDAAAAAKIYAAGRGYDLTANDGDYHHSDKLVGYWRMGDGQDDNVEAGVIHDAHNPGFGSQLWDGTQGDDANWVKHGNNTIAEDDDAVRVTFVDNGDGAYILFSDATDLNTNLTVGATYRCTADVKTNTGSIELSVRHGSSNTNSTSVTSTDYVNREMFFVCEHATNDRLEFNSMGTGEIGWVRNISLKKLNGNPGITSGNPVFVKLPI